MNALTEADVLVEDKLFATLDTRTRPWNLPGGRRVLLSDTVGFIRNLPHHLVASFKATLEEARHADLLLHVVDAAHPDPELQIDAVNAVLEEIGCGDARTLLVLNKADAVSDLAAFNILVANHPGAIVISALRREGLRDLANAVSTEMTRGVLEVKLAFPDSDGRIYAALCQRGEVTARSFSDGEVEVRALMSEKHLSRLLREFPSVRFLPDSPDRLAGDEDEEADE